MAILPDAGSEEFIAGTGSPIASVLWLDDGGKLDLRFVSPSGWSPAVRAPCLWQGR